MSAKQTKTEFGQGFVYSLILFAKHWGALPHTVEAYRKAGIDDPEKSAVSIWFYGAADHFYDFIIPEDLKDTEVGKLALSLQARAMRFRLPVREENELTLEDFDQFFKDLELLARLIDAKLGVEAIEAEWN